MTEQNSSCTKKIQTISAAELPLCCPLPKGHLWDAHPRVYLPIERTEGHKLRCPYCETEYVLE